MPQLDMSAFLEEFRNEVRDHLQKLDNDLVRLEGSPEPDLVNSLFRSAHSIKGAARMMGFNSLSMVAHKMEDILGAIRDGRVKPTSETIDVLLKGADEIERLLGEKSGARADADIVRELEDILSGEVVEEKKEGKKEAHGGEKGREKREAGRTSSLEEEHIRISSSRLNRVLEIATESLMYNLAVEEIARSTANIVHESDRLLEGSKEFLLQVRASGNKELWESGMELSKRAKATHRSLVEISTQSKTLSRRLKGILYELYHSLLDLRLEEFRVLFSPLPRSVRDMARSEGKNVRLEIEGENVEVDRAILKRLQDPLIHLLRNAIDHGIETPEEREKAGKPAFGTIRVKAEQMGRMVHLTVQDDGRGIDVEKVRKLAVERGLVGADEAKTLSPGEVIEFIFLPGFSTSSSVGALSGRGVGMDVVRRAVTEIGGAVRIDSVPGKGTTITLALPATLALSQVLLLESQGQVYGVPIMFVDRALKKEDVTELDGDGEQSLVSWSNEVIPALPMSSVFEESGNGTAKNALLVLESGGHRAGYWVERLIGVEEIAVRPPGPILKGSSLIWGHSILGNGDVLLLLDGRELLDIARKGLARTARRWRGSARPEAEERKPVLVLLVEDSLTTREVERSILLSAGYEVEVAGNGREALEKLREREPDVIVTDIEMPVMDGFELTATVRNDPRYRHIPVIVVTSRSREEDRIKGMQVGAQAYVVKSEFDQEELLETIERLTG